MTSETKRVLAPPSQEVLTIPPEVYAARRDRVRKRLRGKRLSGLLVSSASNVRYLTGFTGEDSWLLVTRDRDLLSSDFRFEEQLREESPGLEVHIRLPSVPLLRATAEVAGRLGVSDLGFEAASLSVQQWASLTDVAPKVSWVATEGLVEGLRAVKDRYEVQAIRAAIHLAERVVEAFRATFTPEQSEAGIAAELEYRIRRLGGEGCSFPSIVAFGPRAALPHAVVSRRTGSGQGLLLVDWGARLGGYVSDLTRVFALSKILPKLRKIHDVVCRAQREAVRQIRPGVEFQLVDRAARRCIEEAGFAKFFGHGLGHGIGLQVHESPRLGPGQTGCLEAGMVVTVEPGIYLPGWGGVRIEDDVLVTPDGCEVLSTLSRDLEECCLH